MTYDGIYLLFRSYVITYLSLNAHATEIVTFALLLHFCVAYLCVIFVTIPFDGTG